MFLILLQLILVVLFLSVVNLIGHLFFAILFGVHDDHYFIGQAPHFFHFKLLQAQFSLGLYIPFSKYSKVYRAEDGAEKRVTMFWEFFEVPILKRLIVVLGGSIFLLATGVSIKILLSYFEERSIITPQEVNKWGVYPSQQAKSLGFEVGDRVLLLNGKEYQEFSELIDPKQGFSFTIERIGERKTIVVPSTFSIDSLHTNSEGPFLEVNAPFLVGEVLFQNGLQKGDKIMFANDISANRISELKHALEQQQGEASLIVERTNGIRKDTIQFLARLNSENKLGIHLYQPITYFVQRRSIWQAIVDGGESSFRVIMLNVRMVYYVLTGSVPTRSTTSGPIRMATFYGSSIWEHFWRIMASFALFGAFLNLLPVPRSAFWQIIPLVYERFTGKRLSEKVYSRVKSWGVYCLIALFVFFVCTDLFRSFNASMRN